jgi:hypothetical protein
MIVQFDRKTYFDAVRKSIFDGEMSQEQVDGQEFLLKAWEEHAGWPDLRWLAYMLATTVHETAATMCPIEEYGKGSGHDYGKPDPETGQAYYGRGFVQLTWRDNYARATKELCLGPDQDLEWNAACALDPAIAARIMGQGMVNGWFTGKKLPTYFNDTTNDPVGARQIINPDDKGELIAGYYEDFLEALEAAERAPGLAPVPITITISAPVPITVTVKEV